MLANGTLANRLASTLKRVRARLSPTSTVVLLGYPQLEGDPNYTLRSGPGGTTLIQVGSRLRAIGVRGEAVQSKVMSSFSAGPHMVFVKTRAVFAGPPSHELYVQKTNSKRWFIQPIVDASQQQTDLWYHPNLTGWTAEATLLYSDSRVPKHPRT